MIEIKDGAFYEDGKKFHIYSGAIHYFRTLPEYWEDRLTKLKLAGFNTVETYVAWNLHEKEPGTFDFGGMLDIRRFLETAQRLGLYAIVRPGPYICAEWENGGLPAWLYRDKNMRIRCNYEPYLAHVKAYYTALMNEIGDLLAVNGGNIIAMQVENEYGSYGNDHDYMRSILDIMHEVGMDTLLFTADGNWKNMLSGGTLDGVYKTLTFGSGAKGAFGALDGFQENMPKMCTEFWCGWFDHWGEKHHKRGAGAIVKELQDFMDIDASFSVYMFHGGTNFGYMAGSNHNGKLQPTCTSYDYNAMLTEWGDTTERYDAVRELMLSRQGITERPEVPKVKYIGDTIMLKMDEVSSLRDNMPNIATHHRSGASEYMEYYGQSYGYIVYSTEITGKYTTLGMPLTIHGLHDRARVYVNGEYVKTIDRNGTGIGAKLSKKECTAHKIALPPIDGKVRIDILVDAMGRVNYGQAMYDRKGIGDVTLGSQLILGWDVYTIPLDDISRVEFGTRGGVAMDDANVTTDAPEFYRAHFDVSDIGEAFVHMDNFSKGLVFVNGFNLGRYWTQKGPQHALYIPGSLLKNKDNELIIFDTEGVKTPEVIIDSRPDIG